MAHENPPIVCRVKLGMTADDFGNAFELVCSDEVIGPSMAQVGSDRAGVAGSGNRKHSWVRRDNDFVLELLEGPAAGSTMSITTTIGDEAELVGRFDMRYRGKRVSDTTLRRLSYVMTTRSWRSQAAHVLAGKSPRTAGQVGWQTTAACTLGTFAVVTALAVVTFGRVSIGSVVLGLAVALGLLEWRLLRQSSGAAIAMLHNAAQNMFVGMIVVGVLLAPRVLGVEVLPFADLLEIFLAMSAVVALGHLIAWAVLRLTGQTARSSRWRGVQALATAAVIIVSVNAAFGPGASALSIPGPAGSAIREYRWSSPASVPNLASTALPSTSSDPLHTEVPGPPIEPERLSVAELPPGWSWTPNSDGGHKFMSSADGVCVRTRSDYALNGFGLNQLKEEMDADYRFHRPGYRDARWSMRDVFGGHRGAIVRFSWYPRNDERNYVGVAHMAIVDDDLYVAEASWPENAPREVVAEAIDLVEALRIPSERADTGTMVAE